MIICRGSRSGCRLEEIILDHLTDGPSAELGEETPTCTFPLIRRLQSCVDLSSLERATSRELAKDSHGAPTICGIQEFEDMQVRMESHQERKERKFKFPRSSSYLSTTGPFDSYSLTPTLVATNTPQDSCPPALMSYRKQMISTARRSTGKHILNDRDVA